MSVKTHRLQHRGALQGLVPVDGSLVFLTLHDEGQPTGLYRLNPLTAAVENQAVPGGSQLCARGADLAYAGVDGHLYAGAFGAVKPLGKTFEPVPSALCFVHQGYALGVGTAVVLVDAKGKERARFEVPSPVSALASDASGQWLAVGCAKGTVHVFSSAESKSWAPLESEKLHEGAVTALSFDPDELRIRSAGADNKLRLTHARGALQAEDRAGRSGHGATVVDLITVEAHSYSVSTDGQLKTWVRGGRRAPATLKEGLATPVAMALITVEGQAHIAVASTDNAIRLCPLEDKSAKALPRTVLFEGAVASAKNGLASTDARVRQAAVDTVASWADVSAVEILASVAANDADHRIRTRATDLLGQLNHPRAIRPLEGLLKNATASVRASAFSGLRSQVGEAVLRPLELALAAAHDLGMLALDALAGLAPTDARAEALIIRTLDAKHEALRNHALQCLEGLHPDDASASQAGFRSKHAGLRWRSGLRLLQRNLLGRPEVGRDLRARTNDADADVRLLAYQLQLLAYPNLADHLRSHDAELHRGLHALTHHGVQKPPKLTKAKKPKSAPESLAPLFQASASRRPDVSLFGAAHLAALADPRALGILLQLSRDDSANIRVRACKALQALADPKGLSRLQSLLRDSDEAVRDAAYSALERVLKSEPLRAATIGLASPEVDVRQRGLKGLSKVLLAKGKTKKPALNLLSRTLNDTSRALRTAAFKLCLKALTPSVDALRFAFQSHQRDVRRDALTEVMGEVRHPWAWTLLLERIDDPAAKLRSEALTFARKKGRGRSPDPVRAALASQYADMRLAALKVLSSKVQDDTLPLLVTALDDDDAGIRSHALQALKGANAQDALVQALSSSFDDVRVDAASTLASIGRVEAADVLLEQVRQDKPEVSDLAKLWTERVKNSLTGLAFLRNADAVAPAVSLLASNDAKLRERAGHVLAWCADEDTLLKHLAHTDKKVQGHCANGLAWLGNSSGASLALSKGPDIQKAIAAVCLGEYEVLLGLLDGSAPDLARRIILMVSWADPDFPDVLLSGLTAQSAVARLSMARVLEVWATDALDQTVCDAINQRRYTPWSFDTAFLRSWALALRYTEGRDRAVFLEPLGQLDHSAYSSKDIAAVELSIRQMVVRAGALTQGRLQTVSDPGPPQSAGLQSLVFGAYVGLSGQVSGRKGRSIRTTALQRMAAMEVEPAILHDALIPGLSDEYYATRAAAFEALRSTGFTRDALVEEALATGHSDMGSLGLTLLAESGGTQVLTDVALTRTDGLEGVAFDLLVERSDAVKAAKSALEATSSSLRSRAVSQLSKSIEVKGAVTALKGALKSKHLEVQALSAFELARHRNAAAQAPLVALLQGPNQDKAIDWLAHLGDAKTPAVLLDRIKNDPEGTANASRLLNAVGMFRDASVVPVLLALVDRKEHVSHALGALLKISGYDQRLQFDGEHPDADERWLKDQHPRNDDVYAQLLPLWVTHKQSRTLRDQWVGVRWCRGSEIEASLVGLVHHADEKIRQNAVAALGWRLRHRKAKPEPLVALLGHKDANTSFLAAEGLALAGNATGLSVLLAAVDTLDAVALRHRAVFALGRLADERAVALLLRIVEDDEHALIESAVEAVGHLSKTDAAETLFACMDRLSKVEGNVARQALVGLRWFNTPSAWVRIREAAVSDDDGLRRVAMAQLAHNDTAETRDLLHTRIVVEHNWRVAQALTESLRHLYGPDSLEPDYQFLRSPHGSPEDDTIARLQADGDPERVLNALAHPNCDDDYVAPLMASLCVRDPLPIDAAVAVLGGSTVTAIALGARLLGRAKKLKASPKKAISATLVRLLDDWYTRELFAGAETGDALSWLLWASARHKLDAQQISTALMLTGEGADAVHEAAAKALSVQPEPEVVAAAMVHSSAVVRAAAATAMACSTGPRSAVDMSDRTVSQRFLTKVDVDVDAALGSVHAQGNVLQHAVRSGKLAALTGALTSPEELVQYGAVEGLGAMGQADAEAQLQQFATDPSHDEMLRKAAWRALRRSKRIRAAQEARR